jgi:L-threonylcarbamoyladenylate synthase
MNTVRLVVDPRNPADSLLEQAAAVLRRGGVVAMPTETVYGLAANALDAAAVERIYSAKGRPANNPVIVHVATVAQAQSLVADWPAAADRLAAAFWPGPLTMVLPRSPRVPEIVTAGGPTVAVRMPAHRVARRLLELSGLALAAPSANTSTRVSPTTADHVMQMLDGRIEMVLDAGPAAGGIESTVVGWLDSMPRILRPGPIDAASLAAVLGVPVEIHTHLASEAQSQPLASPGTMARHYAPLAVLECVAPSEAARRVAQLVAGGSRVGWLSFDSAARVAPGRVEVMPCEPIGYAAKLYAALHALDQAGVTEIVVELPPDEPAWQAIHDRLRRASAPSCI